MFEYEGASKIADRIALRKDTAIFAHDGDVKIKKLLINEKGLNIQEALDTNHKAKNLFYSAANQNSPLYGLYKILRSIFIHVVVHYSPERRYDVFSSLIHNIALKPSSSWKNKDKSTSISALNSKILETKDVLPILNPHAHTNYNESFHALKNHFAPKTVEFRLTWIIRVCFAIIAWNHKDNFMTVLRNFLQGPPPETISGVKFLNKLAEKKKYDEQRRQDHVIQYAIKKRKFQKQPNNFTSPNRHKTIGETLSRDKMKKRSVFPNSKLDLGQNWKQRLFLLKHVKRD